MELQRWSGMIGSVISFGEGRMRFPGSDAERRGRARRPAPGAGRLALLAAVVVLLFGAGTLISWYVEALWFDSLGYGDVFWKTLQLKTDALLRRSRLVTFVLLFAALRLLRPRRRSRADVLYVNGQAGHASRSSRVITHRRPGSWRSSWRSAPAPA